MLPIVNSRVKAKSDSDAAIGRVVGHVVRDGQTMVEVSWGKDGRQTLEFPLQLRSALTPGTDVLHEPHGVGRQSLGKGKVEAVRELAGTEQVLVDFWETGVRRWLPWQSLKPVPGIEHRFVGPIPTRSPDAEAFRLRNLAYALEQWHTNTGALTQLEIDPLPHQIHLVHRIITSGNLNWMIADDVGLGKTIEVGLLLAALRRRDYRRFLLIVPAGLTRQWKEEMRDKFAIDDFMIYGEDFNVENVQQWKLFDRVIVSVDRIKLDNHLANFMRADKWDLVVFDEAHWLSRHEKGFTYDHSDRYLMAREMRRKTDSLLLLTGTPHQGKDDKFRGLLELLRPGDEWRGRFLRLHTQPEVLKDLIIRNRKADVTDASGEFIFLGKETHTVAVSQSQEEQAFDGALQEYLRKGYAVSSIGRAGILVGFVMTIYRKLAASSTAAIVGALERRKVKIANGILNQAEQIDEDDRFVEKDEFQTGEAKEFFAGELRLLDQLTKFGARLLQSDSKLKYLVEEVVPGILAGNPHERVVIFTEYRGTQDHISQALASRFGPDKVHQINGGQKFVQRSSAIEAFQETGQFLISTEAGGEGLNLQKNCHIMINYDLPWNPMRLVQRVGRLYRYGQSERVVVFNLHVPDTLDSEVLQTMYHRLEAVSKDMAGVADEYRDGLKEDILGQLVGNLDMVKVEEALEAARDGQIERSEERLAEALRLAQDAMNRQDEILSNASRFNPEELKHELRLTVEHLKAFAGGMCDLLKVEVTARLHNDNAWDLRLPEELARKLRKPQRVRITFERGLSTKSINSEVFAPESDIFEAFVKIAKAQGSGEHAAVNELAAEYGLGAMIRWMDQSGMPLFQEYVGVLMDEKGRARINDQEWADLLLQPMSGLKTTTPQPRAIWKALVDTLVGELRRRLDGDVQPDMPYPIGVIWREP